MARFFSVWHLACVLLIASVAEAALLLCDPGVCCCPSGTMTLRQAGNIITLTSNATGVGCTGAGNTLSVSCSLRANLTTCVNASAGLVIHKSFTRMSVKFACAASPINITCVSDSGCLASTNWPGTYEVDAGSMEERNKKNTQ
jgi:hypothetical protein